MWNKNDPREVIYKSQDIAIMTHNGLIGANVETKHGYSIDLDRKVDNVGDFIGAGDDWPKDWRWVCIPDRNDWS